MSPQGFFEIGGALRWGFIQDAAPWLLMISDRPFLPVRHAAVFTFLGVGILVISAAAGSRVTGNTVLLEAITALGPVVLWAGYRSRWQRPEVMPVAVAMRCFFLWLCPVLVVLANVYGMHLSKWPDVGTVSKVAVYCVLIGVAEELTFRGVIHAAFRALSPAWYVVISSVLFGVLHYSQGLEGIGITFIVGLAFGLAKVADMPLLALILCHAVIDMPGALSAVHTGAYLTMACGALIYTALVALVFLIRREHWQRPILQEEGGARPEFET